MNNLVNEFIILFPKRILHCGSLGNFNIFKFFLFFYFLSRHRIFTIIRNEDGNSQTHFSYVWSRMSRDAQCEAPPAPAASQPHMNVRNAD